MPEIFFNDKNTPEKIFFLSELVNTKVLFGAKKIGKLSDFIIIDRDKIAEVTHFYVVRPFGDPALVIPLDKVRSFDTNQIVFDVQDADQYVVTPVETTLFLKDYILDKRVVDIEGREVEVVYDVKMIWRANKLYISDVDLSHYSLLRRMGLKWLANFIYNMADKIKSQIVSWEYVEPLPTQIDGFKGDIKLKVLKERLADMQPMDLADILEELDSQQRAEIFNGLDPEQASDTLEELNPNVQRDLIGVLKKDKTATLINEMTPGQAADILSVLPWKEVRTLLKLIKPDRAQKIQSILEKQEEKLVNFGVSECLKFPPEMTVEQVRNNFQSAAKGKDVIMYIYVVGLGDTLLGVIDLKELLKADESALLKDVMDDRVITLNTDSTLKEASVLFARYGFRALPIVDEKDKMVGVVPYRDVMKLKHLYFE
ncbi:MAG: magnesium transporter [Candidatus Omnitrophica bacterium]|nr:magnesium transporter [Candidatus Omnitrophota bacterium]